MSQLVLYVDDRLEDIWAVSACIALEEKRLPYHLERVTTLDDVRDFNARILQLPVLVRGEYWLTESVAIAEYLAENFPYPAHPRLFPADLAMRGHCRELQAWLRRSPSRQRVVDWAEAHLDEEGGYLFGDWCIADADLTLALGDADQVPSRVEQFIRLNRQRESFRRLAERRGNF